MTEKKKTTTEPKAKKERVPVSAKSDFQIGAQLEKTFNALTPERACRILNLLVSQQSERASRAAAEAARACSGNGTTAA